MDDSLTNQGEYNQSSFIGGMSLLGDDSRLGPTQYRLGINLTNRFDELDPILASKEDTALPLKGTIQEFVTFGKYLIIFINGLAFYRFYTDTGWKPITGFKMSADAPRFWSVAIPVSTTNYVRLAATGTVNQKTANPAGAIETSQVAGAASGNLPGLLVQDNINQPEFIFIDNTGFPTTRTTQNFREWMISYTDANNTTIGPVNANLIPSGSGYVGGTNVFLIPGVVNGTSYQLTAGIHETNYSLDNGVTFIAIASPNTYTVVAGSHGILLQAGSNTTVTASIVLTIPLNDPSFDNREYVPIGSSMSWANGILVITSQDTNFLYRSVSGRPLDFVVNVSNLLATNVNPYDYTYTDTITGNIYDVVVPSFTQVGGGDATTTAYSVGVGGISCVRAVSTGGWFISASGSNFSVTLNQTPSAPTIFGEYTFIRAFLFNANCLTDRGIFDSLGDTKFIDLTGVRSFNAILQLQNEGRNSVFTNSISAAFQGIIQDPNNVAGILFDNYELYAVNTIFGAAIAKFDTINSCWTSFDLPQTAGSLVKILAKIELDIQALYAITQDNRLFQLYVGPEDAIASVRTVAVCANILYANENIKMNNPKSEIKLNGVRVILNKITEDCSCSILPFVNNRVTDNGTDTKIITYSAPDIEYIANDSLPDVNTLLVNLYFPTPDCEQGWKAFCILKWTDGVVTQYSFEMNTQTPVNPISAQESSK